MQATERVRQTLRLHPVALTQQLSSCYFRCSRLHSKHAREMRLDASGVFSEERVLDLELVLTASSRAEAHDPYVRGESARACSYYMYASQEVL